MKSDKSLVKYITELLPLIIFFLLYKSSGIFYATVGIIVASLVTTLISFFINKKISYMPLITCLVLAIFGGITIYSGDTKYIKMKPTIINVLFSLVLIVGVICKKGLIQYILGGSIKMTNDIWIIFSKRWAYFFLFIALLNEIIWRNFSENFWVNFKVFGIVILTIVFIVSQLGFIKKHHIE